MPFVAGCAFHVPTSDGGKHVFVVTCDPCDVKGHRPQSCTLVNLSTVKASPHDSTCVLDPGCHPSVVVKSFAVYKMATVQAVAELESLVRSGVYKPTQPFDTAIVARLAAGMMASPHTRNSVKEFLRGRQASLEAAARIAKRRAAEQGEGKELPGDG